MTGATFLSDRILLHITEETGKSSRTLSVSSQPATKILLDAVDYLAELSRGHLFVSETQLASLHREFLDVPDLFALCKKLQHDIL